MSKGEVLVTGGTGYIGSSLIRRLLQEGYKVRTTVRNSQNTANTAFLLKLEGAKDRLRIVDADLMQEGSFDAAVDGVEGVFHTAGPVFPKNGTGDPQVDMIDPSVKGALNVLRACARASRSVRRVVMTSSCSAIRYDSRDEIRRPLDEGDWSSIPYCQQRKMWYALSKTIAEQGAWKFAKEHNLDLVVVNPSFVIGPFLGDFPTSTISYVLFLLNGKFEEYRNQYIGFVHIDDVVTTHILAYEKAEACGRYICSSSVEHWKNILSLIGSKHPGFHIPKRCGEDDGDAIQHTLNTNKVHRLGITSFKLVESMIDDCISDLLRKGLLQQAPGE